MGFVKDVPDRIHDDNFGSLGSIIILFFSLGLLLGLFIGREVQRSVDKSCKNIADDLITLEEMKGETVWLNGVANGKGGKCLISIRKRFEDPKFYNLESGQRRIEELMREYENPKKPK